MGSSISASGYLVWLFALTCVLGCSHASDGKGFRDWDASLEESAHALEPHLAEDEDESPHQVSLTSGDVSLAGTLICGRSGYASSACPNASASVSGWPEAPVSGSTYSTTGWKGQLGQVGPGLANTWVTIELRRTNATGDPDLYVKKNGNVSASSYDCRPWTVSNPEYCAFYLDSDTDYLTWGIDVYSVSNGSTTVRVDIDVRRCAAGTVYTGIGSFADSGANAPPAMKCCNCAEGFSEQDNECCRTIAECTQSSDCESGFCVDGYCCDKACAGGCERCNAPGAEGLCRTVSAGAALCGGYVCNGNDPSCPTSCSNQSQCANSHYCNGSSCLPKLDNGSACVSPVQCKTGHCSEDFCCDAACGNYLCKGWAGSCPTSCASDADCLSTAYCNANKACVPRLPLGGFCTTNNQCASGACADGVCCNTACGNACDRCDQPGSVGTCRNVTAGSVGQPSCGAYVCDGQSANCPVGCSSDAGCASGYICKAGVCEPKAQNGSVCSRGSECQSGFCIDGVCCDAVCNGGCDRCDLSGSKGVCTFVSAGTESASCGRYVCNGKDASCPSSCSTGSDCTDDAYCYAGSCEPKSTVGIACSSDAACESGFCVDGTCCESACDGQCERCDAKGAVGSCVPVQGKPVGQREACGDDGSGCGGVCDGVNGESCAYPGEAIVCASASCANDVEVLSGSCDGAGSCAREERSCAPYACGGASCLSSCASHADCSESAECKDGQCRGAKGEGSGCTTGAECESGHCVSGICCGSESGCGGDEGPGGDFLLSDDESGCGCATVGSGRNTGGGLLAGLMFGLAILRRKGRQIRP